MTLNLLNCGRLAAAIATSSVLLAGCSTLTPGERLQMQADAERPVVCSGQPDCEVKWGRAVEWVLSNSSYKIAVQTPTLITTMGPLPQDSSSAFTISRAPDGRGGYTFSFRAGCDNMFACIPSLVSLQASFVRAVMRP